jgi:hypothetical protein
MIKNKNKSFKPFVTPKNLASQFVFPPTYHSYVINYFGYILLNKKIKWKRFFKIKKSKY